MDDEVLLEITTTAIASSMQATRARLAIRMTGRLVSDGGGEEIDFIMGKPGVVFHLMDTEGKGICIADEADRRLRR